MKHFLVNNFDEQDWTEILSREPGGYSWTEEAYIAGEEYFEADKAFMRCN